MQIGRRAFLNTPFSICLVINNLPQYIGNDVALFLLNIFINDIQRAVSNKLMKSAGDTKLRGDKNISEGTAVT